MGDYMSQNSLCVAFKTEELNFNVLIVEAQLKVRIWLCCKSQSIEL